MMRTLLESKLHRVTVTQTELHYEDSCAMDEDLLEAADLREYERVDICNVNSGQRFSTHEVKAPRGSGTSCMMGAAARLASAGDRPIVAAYASFDERELPGFKPRVVRVDEENHILDVESASAGLPRP